MSFKNTAIYPPNPVSSRGVSTKLAASKGKLVYANGKSIIIHDIKNPIQAKIFTGHTQNTTVARFSPSGYYCASADVTGAVKVWDTVGEDQTIKGDYKVINGRINDLCWDGESKRIIAVGDGRDKFGHAFMMDTGTSTGEIVGHSKAVNAVSIRHQRPFRAATAGDDNTIVFHTGVPFKFEKTIKTHTKFIQDVQYAPSGDNFASVGSDFKLFVYDGKTGDVKADIADSPHKGSIMACSWNTDSKSIVTAAADCTVKLWDAEAQKAVNSWTVGSGIDYQQVGAVWSGDQEFVSLSLSGTLNIFDPRTADKPARIFEAPRKAVNAMAPSSSSGTFLAGCADGRVLSYSAEESTLLNGETHSNYVSGLASSPKDGKIYSIGYDDKVREIDADGQSFVPASVSTSSQPRGITVTDDSTVLVVEQGVIEAFRSNQKVFEHKPRYTPSVIAARGNFVAVGGEDQKVHLNEWDGKELKETGVLEGNRGTISAASFSPDGKYLVVGDTTGRLVLYDPNEKTTVTSRWTYHSARVNSLAWTSDSLHIASGSLDSYVYIWSVKRLLKNIPIKLAGPGGVNAVLWKDDKTLVSSGADGCVRAWEITFHPPA